jgi:peptide/nickel transport system permease protein
MSVSATTQDGFSASYQQRGAMGIVARLWNAVINELRLALRTNAGRIGLPLVALYVFLAIFGPYLTPYPPTEHHVDLSAEQIAAAAEREVEVGGNQLTGQSEFRLELGEDQLATPSLKFLLGTDEFGRDILSRVMAGARSIIIVSVSAAALGIFLGTVVGMASGYKGGKTDEVVMRIMDGVMSFPSLLLALLVLSMLGSNQVNIVATIGVVFMPRVARVMRSATLALKDLEFVQNARLRGESSLYIIFREILPNAVPVLGVEASVRLSYAILIAASLGFLGLGVQPPSSDWGVMISESQKFIVQAPWVALVPAGAVATLVVGVNLLADGLRQARGLPVTEGA